MDCTHGLHNLFHHQCSKQSKCRPVDLRLKKEHELNLKTQEKAYQYRIRCRVRYRIRCNFFTSYVTYDIVCDVKNRISYTMSYTISYVNLRCRIRYLKTYDIVGHIVGRDTVLANRTYDIVRPIVSDVVCQTYDIVYDFMFSYDIVGGRTVLANRTSRRRIRYRRCTSISYTTS